MAADTVTDRREPSMEAVIADSAAEPESAAAQDGRAAGSAVAPAWAAEVDSMAEAVEPAWVAAEVSAAVVAVDFTVAVVVDSTAVVDAVAAADVAKTEFE